MWLSVRSSTWLQQTKKHFLNGYPSRHWWKKWKKTQIIGKILFSWIGRINIVKMSTVFKATGRFSGIPIKIQIAFFPTEIEKKILNFVWDCKRPRISQSNLEKEKSWIICKFKFLIFWEISILFFTMSVPIYIPTYSCLYSTSLKIFVFFSFW